MSNIETVKIKHKHGDGGADTHYAIINKSDFDPKKHKLHGENDDANLADADEGIRKQREAERTYEANRGISGGPGLSTDGKNPSGTYSEPTPTDVRYPNKDATEFENNHGAFVGKSAAEMREAEGMDDKPGGLIPEQKEAVDAVQSAAKRADKDAHASDKRPGRKPAEPTDNVDDMTVAQLREYADAKDIDLEGATLKDDILAKVKAAK